MVVMGEHYAQTCCGSPRPFPTPCPGHLLHLAVPDLDPFITKNGFINVLKKYRIIREITGMGFYNYVEVPIAKINMGKLREFDSMGVRKHQEERMNKYRQ